MPAIPNNWRFGFWRSGPVLKAGLLLCLLFFLSRSPVLAATIYVDTTCSLLEAMEVANGDMAHADCEASSDDADTIDLSNTPNNIVALTADLPHITSDIKIVGGSGIAINGQDTYSIFYVEANAHLTIEYVSISAGVNYNGGAIYVAGQGELTLSSSVVHSNLAEVAAGVDSGYGGEIYLAAGSEATIENSSIATNTSGYSGGGILCGEGSIVNISHSAIYDNETTNGSGGGFFIDQCHAGLTNSTLYDNSASNMGGAVYMNLYADLSSNSVFFSHVTITDNTAASGKGGGIRNSGTGGTGIEAAFDMHNSIVYGNTGDDCVDATPATNAGNLYATGNCAAASVTSDPRLSFVNRVGTKYYSLPADSPAVDAGDSSSNRCLSDDQLYKPRPKGASCDIGSFEHQMPAAPTPTPTPPLDDSPGSNDVSSGSTGSSAFAGSAGSAGSAGPEGSLVPAPRKTVSSCLFGLPDSIQVFGVASHGTQCRQMDATAVGVKSLVEGAFIDALDVWSYLAAGVEVCFRAAGSLVFLDAENMPRYPEPMPAYSKGGMTCGFVSRPGSVVLMPGSPPPPKVESLAGCMVTTTHILNLRGSPAGEVILHLPYDVTLTAIARVDDWFQVDYHGEVGWITTEYVVSAGNCG